MLCRVLSSGVNYSVMESSYYFNVKFSSTRILEAQTFSDCKDIFLPNMPKEYF
jgi:hypothetical protein